jgi:hypothetical protein
MSLSSSGPAAKSGRGSDPTIAHNDNHQTRDRRRSGRPSTTASTAPQKIDIFISIYDLLPRNHLSNFLWTVGAGLLHSGVVVGDREYAFGGHNQLGVTGVYWTRPHLEPPGSAFRTAIWRGCTYRTEKETEAIVKEVCTYMIPPSVEIIPKCANINTNPLFLLYTGLRSFPRSIL